MRRIAQLVLITISLATANAARTHARHPHPYRQHWKHSTPGAVLLVDRAAVCQPGYSKNVRKVPQHVRQEVFASYGIACDRCEVSYELDHLVPLCLGGSNDAANLWPQPYKRPGARDKDRVERYLHARVCSGRMTLTEAQRRIASDWYSAWLGVVLAHGLPQL